MLLLFMPLQGFTEGSCPNHSERTTAVRNEGFPQDRSLGSSWGARLDHCGRFARSQLISHPIVAHSREAGRQNVAVILHTTLNFTKFIFTLCNKVMAWWISKYVFFSRPQRAVFLDSLPRELIHVLLTHAAWGSLSQNWTSLLPVDLDIIITSPTIKMIIIVITIFCQQMTSSSRFWERTMYDIPLTPDPWVR